MLLRTRLRLAALIPAVLSLLVGAVLWHANFRSDEARGEAELAAQVRAANFELNILAQEYLLYGGARVQSQLLTRHRSMGDLLARLKFEEPEGRELVETLRRNHLELGSIYALLLGSQSTSQPQIAGALLIKSQAIRAKSQRLFDIQNRQALEVQRRTNTIVAGALILMAGLSLILLTLLMRRLIAGIGQLEKGVRRVAAGDLRVSLSLVTTDELGGLAQSFNSMTETIRQRDEALRTAEADQRKERGFIDAVFDTANSLIVVLDREGRIVRLNRAGESLVGYRFDEIQGRHFWDIFLPDLDREAVKAVFQHIRAGAIVARYENHWHCKDGSARLFDWSNAVLLDERGEVEFVVSVGVDTTERKQMEERVRQQAFYDALTNLPNRRLLNDRLSQIMAITKRSGCFGALMFLDLDNFKPLNDQYGHGVGDLLLIEVGNRLKSCVREMDTVGRFGGDEFVVILAELNSDKDASTTQARVVAEKIGTALAEPYRLVMRDDRKADATIEHRCTACIGVTVFIDHEASQDDIMRRADMAMYQAKKVGPNSILFYEAEGQ